MIDADYLEPLQALVRGVNPHFIARVAEQTESDVTFEVGMADKPFKEVSEVAITRFSTGASFAFTDRGIPLPLTVV